MANKKYIIALGLTIVVAVAIKVSNPYRKYSTQEFWETATVATVQEVPQAALKRGNRNGSVLMWAAMGTKDPAIIRALVARGADVNESDPMFAGTPLTGAAGYGKDPAIVDELVQLGADINKRVNHDETALMIAAQYNKNPKIITALYAAGAELDSVDVHGITALDFARRTGNAAAVAELQRLANAK